MSTPIDPANIPAVPRRDYDVTDRLDQLRSTTSELRQTFVGVTRGADAGGNQVLGSDALATWGVAKPRIHVPAYPTAPYLSTPAGGGYTWTCFYSHTFHPESQQINAYIRWAVLEAVLANTAVGEFEARWNKGVMPNPRGDTPSSSMLFSAWNSGTPGSKGLDGSSIQSIAFQLPTSGPYAVTYWDPAWVTVGIWGHIRTATGTANDAAKVAPLGLYQSGIGQG